MASQRTTSIDPSFAGVTFGSENIRKHCFIGYIHTQSCVTPNISHYTTAASFCYLFVSVSIYIVSGNDWDTERNHFRR